MQTNLTGNPEQTEMKLTNESIALLKTGAKWAKFLAIIGFIGTGFMVLAALLMLAVSSSEKYGLMGSHMPNGLLGLIYILMAGVYFYPTMCLFNFSDKIKKAFITLKNNILVESFRNLKNMFQYIGIVTIVFIGLYFIGILILVIVMMGRLV